MSYYLDFLYTLIELVKLSHHYPFHLRMIFFVWENSMPHFHLGQAWPMVSVPTNQPCSCRMKVATDNT